MTLIQIKLPADLDEAAAIYKIKKKLKTKEEAVIELARKGMGL